MEKEKRVERGGVCSIWLMITVRVSREKEVRPCKERPGESGARNVIVEGKPAVAPFEQKTIGGKTEPS